MCTWKKENVCVGQNLSILNKMMKFNKKLSYEVDFEQNVQKVAQHKEKGVEKVIVTQ